MTKLLTGGRCLGALLLACSTGFITLAVAAEPTPAKAAEQPAVKAAEQPTGKGAEAPTGKAVTQPTPKAAAQPYFTVEPLKLELTPGQSADTRVFIIVGYGLPKEVNIAEVRDVTKQDGSPVKATFTLKGDYGGSEPRRWSYVGEFAGLGSAYSQKRQLGVLLSDKQEYFADYELTNRPSGDAGYTLFYDDKWFVDSAQGAFKLTVTANDHAVGPLKLANSTLAIEKRSTTIPVTALALCANREGQRCDAVPALRPNTPTEIYLRVASSTREGTSPSALPPGSFNGKLKLVANDLKAEKAEKDVSINVISTRPCAWFWGMVAILGGVSVSLLLLAHRHYAARLAAYEPLLQASERIVLLLGRFKVQRMKLGVHAETRVEQYYRDDLQTRIASFEPSPWDFLTAFVPGGVKSIDASTAAEIQGRVLGLGVMVVEGAEDPRCQRAQIEKFGEDEKNIKTETEARVFVNEQLKAAGLKTTAEARGEKPSLSTEKLHAILVRSGGLDAVFYVIVATLIGYFVLIDDRPGFGALTDYIIAFFWGLGVPATVQGVKDLTRDRVAGSLSISLPVVPGAAKPPVQP